MNDTLTGKVALVTGASSGIGRATALALGRAGATVIAGARRRDGLDALVSDGPGEIIAVELDVTNRDSVARAVAVAVDRFGRLDALVNNAGLMLSGMIDGADIDEWVRMVETNLLGSMYAVHAALPYLIESHGTVVQVSSTVARNASPGNGAYSATKFGIAAFSESLRQEVAGRGVRVVQVAPGFVATELTTHITDPTMRAAAGEIAKSFRTLDPENIAEAVVYALSQPAHVSVNEMLIRPTEQAR
ncbi:SDR family oxidoreductase [Planctomonas sp. JC2975]|uniref:SDR family oxidoreductase n=1 Tax=Planctomonas sp. JC2975 TaxID=2729626 RepID=UPI001473B5D2|nr:SDR family oxidoreductase [Planctomonas sp. JC2975]NNC11100.1 SDR family oxidoreductase [Planctomonas sp. JC2975]